jgi:uncharacterized membrane protein YkvA (DUF1232 family)
VGLNSLEEEPVSRHRRKAAYTVAATAAMSEGPLSFGQRVASLPGLVRDTVNGQYDGLGRGRLAMMAVALVYIVSPIDVLPEALLTLPGMMDDAAVAAWLIASLMGATTAYRAWSGSGAAPTVSTDGISDPAAAGGPSATDPRANRIVVGEVVTP